MWVVATIVFFIKPTVGALWILSTGIVLETAVMTYGIITEHMPKSELAIPVGGHVLNPSFGWSFFLVLLAGILSMVMGLAMYLYLYLFPEENNMFSREAWHQKTPAKTPPYTRYHGLHLRVILAYKPFTQRPGTPAHAKQVH